MLPVHKYVDMVHPDFKGKGDFELWDMLNFDVRMLVTVEYMGDRLESAIGRLGAVVVASILAAGHPSAPDSAKKGGDVKSTPTASA